MGEIREPPEHLPEHVAAGLLRAVSANLGGDLVLWAKVEAGDLVTIMAVVDPVPAAQVAADRIQRDPVSAPDSIIAVVARRFERVVVPRLDPADKSMGAWPDPWPDFLREHPVHGLIAVPERTADGNTVVLIAGRRRLYAPYDDGDLVLVRDAARRMAGEQAPPPEAPQEPVALAVAEPTRRFWADRRLAAVGLGIALPLAALALFLLTDEPSDYLPGSVFLLCCVVAALVVGTWGAAAATVAGTVALWWGLKEPRYSFRVQSSADVVGLAVFAFSGAGVAWAVRRLEAARSSERVERRLSDALLDEAPVVSAALADVTQDVVTRERAEWLLRLTQALSNAIDHDQVAATVCRHLVEVFRGRAAFLVRVGGELQVRGLAGFSEADAHGWREMSIDVGVPSPLSDAVLGRRPLAVPSPTEFEKRYPARSSERATYWDSACLAVGFGTDRGRGAGDGVMYVGWRAPRAITPQSVILMDTVASVVTLVRARISATNAAHQLEFRSALDAMIDSVAIGRAIRSESGEITDFELEFVNVSSVDGRDESAESVIGRRVGDVHPRYRSSGMFDRLRHVVETGEPFQADRMRDEDPTSQAGGPVRWMSLQVSKLGDGYIAASRDVTAVVLAEEAARTAHRQREAERITVELLQGAALPANLPEVRGVGLAAAYVPCAIEQPVGGDWYDAFLIDDERLALVIADVAGHGQPAAAFMLQVRNVFRAIAVEHAEPGTVMHRANEVTCRLNVPDGPFVTCCYAVLHLPTRRLQWAQAGHFSPIVQHADGEVMTLPEHSGLPLALYPKQTYRTSFVQLAPGDRVVMFTDGLVERRREHIDIGLDRLRGRLAALADLPVDRLVDTIAAEVTGRFDDLAVIGLAVER